MGRGTIAIGLLVGALLLAMRLSFAYEWEPNTIVAVVAGVAVGCFVLDRWVMG